jgi:hypothetical protein
MSKHSSRNSGGRQALSKQEEFNPNLSIDQYTSSNLKTLMAKYLVPNRRELTKKTEYYEALTNWLPELRAQEEANRVKFAHWGGNDIDNMKKKELMELAGPNYLSISGRSNYAKVEDLRAFIKRYYEQVNSGNNNNIATSAPANVTVYESWRPNAYYSKKQLQDLAHASSVKVLASMTIAQMREALNNPTTVAEAKAHAKANSAARKSKSVGIVSIENMSLKDLRLLAKKHAIAGLGKRQISVVRQALKDLGITGTDTVVIPEVHRTKLSARKQKVYEGTGKKLTTSTTPGFAKPESYTCGLPPLPKREETVLGDINYDLLMRGIAKSLGLDATSSNAVMIDAIKEFAVWNADSIVSSIDASLAGYPELEAYLNGAEETESYVDIPKVSEKAAFDKLVKTVKKAWNGIHGSVGKNDAREVLRFFRETIYPLVAQNASRAILKATAVSSNNRAKASQSSQPRARLGSGTPVIVQVEEKSPVTTTKVTVQTTTTPTVEVPPKPSPPRAKKAMPNITAPRVKKAMPQVSIASAIKKGQ